MQALEAACDLLGGQYKLADAIRRTSPSISEWKRRKVIPEDCCEPIEAVTDGAVRVEELRPDLRWRRDASGRVVGVEKPIKPTARHVRKRARPPARTRAPRNPDLHAGR